MNHKSEDRQEGEGGGVGIHTLPLNLPLCLKLPISPLSPPAAHAPIPNLPLFKTFIATLTETKNGPSYNIISISINITGVFFVYFIAKVYSN